MSCPYPQPRAPSLGLRGWVGGGEVTPQFLGISACNLSRIPPGAPTPLKKTSPCRVQCGMRIRIAVLLGLAATALGAAHSDSTGLVVHEWGTFLQMNGSDGVSLDGMYHEEHALPSFVHARSRD